MSYLKFERALMTNLEESLSRELLRTNRSGAYSCSTIVDCNTSKYHGLLVVPVPEMDDDNHVLLSSTTIAQRVTSTFVSSIATKCPQRFIASAACC